jgi:drug/metabolite transporter (DMT)-like permease
VLLLGLYGLLAPPVRLPGAAAGASGRGQPGQLPLAAPDRSALPGAGAGRHRPHHLLGALSGFAGAALLVTGGRLELPAAGLPGYGLAALGAFIWATYSLLTTRLGQVPTSAVAVSCLASGLVALLGHLALEPRWSPAAAELPALLAIGLGPMGAAFYLWDRALKDGDPRTIGTLAYLTPLLSTALLGASGAGRITPR